MNEVEVISGEIEEIEKIVEKEKLERKKSQYIGNSLSDLSKLKESDAT